MKTRMPILKSLVATLVSSVASVMATGQTVDLSAYYDFLTVDGFTSTYVGSIDDGEEVLSSQWIYRVSVLEESDAGVLSEEEMIMAFETVNGLIQTSVKSLYEVTSAAVFYRGGETSVLPDTGFSTVIEVVDGASIFFPSEVTVPSQISWMGTYRTTVTVLPIIPPFVSDTETSGTADFLGFETITVPAGTFEALKVLTTETDEEGTITSLSWYGQGIGLLKTELEEPGEGSEPVVFTYELASYEGYTPETPVSRILAGSVEFGGVLFSDWLGYFDTYDDSDWLYHNGLGYIYAASVAGLDGYWFYVPFADFGYLYFSAQLLHSADNGELAGWVYSLSGGGSWLRIEVDPNGTVRVSINGTGDWIEYGG